MNKLYSIYFWLPNFARVGILGKVINYIFLKILKIIFDRYMPGYLRKTGDQAGLGINTVPREEKYIVSLTSFPARINDIWISIDTMLRQTFKPDMVILWLAEEQFPDKKLPVELLDLQKRGLIIRYCDDLRSHKKYYYTLVEYPDANIITVDDDSYYPSTILESLIELHIKNKGVVCANRAHLITFDEAGNIKPYRSWKHNYKKITQPSQLLVPTGVGGVLYPPASLNEKVLDKTIFKEICFFADDLWLKANGYLNNTPVVTTKRFNKDLIAVSKTQNEKLLSQNSFGGGNDVQFTKVLDYFKIDINRKYNEQKS